MRNSAEEAAFLVALTGPLNGQRWAISHNLILGREPDCDIVINDRQVSRRHAKIIPGNQSPTLTDLKSKNGTHLNGVTLEGSSALHDGDVIQIALVQKFIFLSSDSTLPLDSPELEWDTVANLAFEINRTSQGLRLDKRSRKVWITFLNEDQYPSGGRDFAATLSLSIPSVGYSIPTPRKSGFTTGPGSSGVGGKTSL